MDLIDEENELNLFDHDWRVYSVNPNEPPQYISEEASVEGSLVNEGCTIEGTIRKSVLFQGTTVKKGAHVSRSVIMPEAVIGENAYIEQAIVPSNVKVPSGLCIMPEEGSDEIILVTESFIETLLEQEKV
jgi:glucose-1-phosphate adenylyltransferase